MRKCVSCKTENPDDAKYCRSCGRQFELLYKEPTPPPTPPKSDKSDDDAPGWQYIVCGILFIIWILSKVL